MPQSNHPATPRPDHRWLAVPLIFALWTAVVVATLRTFAERIPELRLVGLGLSLDSLKQVVAGVAAAMKEDHLQLAGLLGFLFL